MLDPVSLPVSDDEGEPVGLRVELFVTDCDPDRDWENDCVELEVDSGDDDWVWEGVLELLGLWVTLALTVSEEVTV